MSINTLWGWFGLSRASFLVLPRVCMQDMPEEWQNKMTALLVEYETTFPNQPDITTRVQAVDYRTKRITSFPEWLLNYRHPSRDDLDHMRGLS